MRKVNPSASANSASAITPTALDQYLEVLEPVGSGSCGVLGAAEIWLLK